MKMRDFASLLLLASPSLHAGEVSLKDAALRKDFTACWDLLQAQADPLDRQKSSFDPSQPQIHALTENPYAAHSPDGPHLVTASNPAFLIYSFDAQAVCLFNAQKFDGTYSLKEKGQPFADEVYENKKWIPIKGSAWYIRDPFTVFEEPIPVVQFAIAGKTLAKKMRLQVEGGDPAELLIEKYSSSDRDCLPALKLALERMTSDKIAPACETLKEKLGK